MRAKTKARLAREPLSWEPVLRGEIYCAPACGGGCTKARHDRCVRDAAKLVARLGAGWEPRVNENLGWHYGATSADGRWYVIAHGHGASSYSAFLGRVGSLSGKWSAHGHTPEQAIAATWAMAKQEILDTVKFLLAEPADEIIKRAKGNR